MLQLSNHEGELHSILYLEQVAVMLSSQETTWLICLVVGEVPICSDYDLIQSHMAMTSY